MRKLFGFALVVVLAAGCKDSSSTTSTAASGSDESSAQSGRPSRSGKIDIGPRKPSVPGAPDTADQGSGERTRPSIQELEDRRKARMAQFDTDGDGKISEDERKAARHKRAEDMRKQADTNGDGKVTVDEISKGSFRRLDPEAIDTNKDGDISVDELEAALEARGKQWGAGRMGRFDRSDRMKQLGRTGSDSGSGSAN